MFSLLSCPSLLYWFKNAIVTFCGFFLSAAITITLPLRTEAYSVKANDFGIKYLRGTHDYV